MRVQRKSPGEIAQALGERTKSAGGWRRETFTMARPAARAKAREWFDRFPKAAYMTEIEFWRELEDGRIEFTIRRLPTAD
ncbi:hypothetical protein [Methylocella sp. CPCC 101449]|uniref:hypothetical protein n=1 Tax=Methylocella sp. CPCC 101449 TaxID=2987531 RepID=UPI00288C7FC9|nr:hypothetical protein [Methylocella sp. CPCC 101449]MDT2022971.1 hypothetical protein [Methylocella sp. CPCC 101449]HEV2570380.1 hypothetical protein [Beijerinckiaceae bacterium]